MPATLNSRDVHFASFLPWNDREFMIPAMFVDAKTFEVHYTFGRRQKPDETVETLALSGQF